MTKVRDIMTPGAESIHPDASIEEAAQKLAVNDIGVLPICGDDGRLAGMLTDRDIVVKVVAAGKDPSATHVFEVAQRDEVVTIGADDTVEAASRTMKKHKVRRLPVIDGTDMVGIVSQGDLAVHLGDEEAGDLVEKISSAP